MGDTSKSSISRPPGLSLRPDLALSQENRLLRGALEATRQRTREEEQAERERVAQLGVLREANEHLVQATFLASDLQAAAELAAERQTVFLSMLAHELRNPIASIAFANTVMLGLDVDNAKLDKLIDIVGRQTAHLVRLVDDLLDVSRLRTGKLTLQLGAVTLAEIVNGAVATAQPLIQQRKQTVQVELPADGVSLRADQVRLTQLFSNLLINASKFSPPGTVIRVAAVVEGAVVSVTVRDTGNGIAAQDIGRIFELFEQGQDEAGHALFGGMGIGLSLVRSIASLHGGTVSVASGGLGLGSEFTVALPLP